jgi:hypothetical protein
MLDANDDETHAFLRAASGDLERLQTLLADACDTLLARFSGASAALRSTPPARDAALHELGAAVTALQFQDLAQQLIAHTQRRLARCAPGAEGAPNPVTQGGVAAGAVDLF